MKTYRDFKKEVFKKKPEVLKRYKAMQPEYMAFKKIIELRIKNNLTQKQLAKKLGTKQSAISRLEGKMENPTIYFLSRVAEAFGKKLVIEFR